MLLLGVKQWMVRWTIALCALPASLALPGLAFADRAYSAPKTVLVVGDSLSAEYGIARGAGWVALLEARLKTEHVDARVVNASISGDTSAGGRARLPALLRQHHPDVVVLELGANDGLRGLPLAAAEANLAAMIELAQKERAKVLLVGMRLPPNYGRAYTEGFAAMYPALAKRYGTAVVPFMFEGVQLAPANFQPDRLHPVASVHPTILNTIWPRLARLLTSTQR